MRLKSDYRSAAFRAIRTRKLATPVHAPRTRRLVTLLAVGGDVARMQLRRMRREVPAGRVRGRHVRGDRHDEGNQEPAEEPLEGGRRLLRVLLGDLDDGRAGRLRGGRRGRLDRGRELEGSGAERAGVKGGHSDGRSEHGCDGLPHGEPPQRIPPPGHEPRKPRILQRGPAIRKDVDTPGGRGT